MHRALSERYVVVDPAPYPEFLLSLPGGAHVARGRLLADRGSNGSQKFVVLAGSPARAEVVPSFPIRIPSSFLFREELIAEGATSQTGGRGVRLKADFDPAKLRGSDDAGTKFGAGSVA